ncbi:Pimeloyl-ACP methyl ester carboxylesterase [Halopseudomonas sabulinigri]|uniref:Pimeloyl-ACP methyl ester carboxylesterase n=1 Tax=Halopseudomonas sabulinigri TaxID=472181 RepID=A0A1H1LD19_9GAMM|nr:alpha/beta hydrolase [Halopseudomonas sabulinigri]SDR72403.1 Pimeloyl-ACP methyl ester carboxylesterase [Halopseudomonas sabulinigri]
MSRFKSFDGVSIYYQRWGRLSAQPPVVLHHGYVANARINWVIPGFVRRLTLAGRCVIALDARGHGRSEKPHDPAAYGEARMAKDLSCLLNELGLEEVDLVGYSMGATVALLAATQEPRIRRLVAGGIGGNTLHLDSHFHVEGRKALSRAMLASRWSIRNPTLAGFRLLADMVWADRKAMAAQALAFHSTRIPLEKISAPTLIIAGDKDPFAKQPRKLQKAIRGAQLKVVLGDHSSVLIRPGFQRAIVDFLQA